jgi:CTP:molybdopterin cytidylyltransferase MocA
MKILAMVLAGGNGTRLHPLTAEDAKPALPVAHGYRIVDFVLSNLVNSDVSRIYVLGPSPRFNLVNASWPIRGDAYRVRRRMVPPATLALAGTPHIAMGASTNAPIAE